MLNDSWSNLGFFLMGTINVQFDTQPDKRVVGPVVYYSHAPSSPEVSFITSAADHIVNHLLLLGPQMNPSWFVLVSLPKQGVGDFQVILCTEAQEQLVIEIHVTCTLWSQCTLHNCVVSADSHIEVTHWYIFRGYSLHKVVQVFIEDSRLYITSGQYTGRNSVGNQASSVICWGW